jgi:alkylation response protein AidB-like acyl-CoA dehydrogenase
VPTETPNHLEQAEELAPLLRSHAEQAERERRLPAPVVDALTRSGLLRMSLPEAVDGPEVPASTQLQVLERLGRADGAGAWCVMIASTTGLVSGYMPDGALKEVFGDPELAACGVYAPKGKATPEDGGYRVTGQWPFGSGCEHSSWRLGGAFVMDGDKPRTGPGGAPDFRLMLFPASESEVLDTWNVSGLQGTGSHDIAVRDVWVPERRAVQLGPEHRQQSGSLYGFPLFGFLAAEVAAVALGMGRGAIDALVDLAGGKVPSTGRRRLADRGLVQREVAEAEAMLQSSRAFLMGTVAELEQQLAQGHEPSQQDRALLRLSALHATRSAADATERMYTVGGGTSIYSSHPLQRFFRDVHTATQHAMVAPLLYEPLGKLFLGLEVDSSQF